MNLPIDDERQLIGTVFYYRVPNLDKRIGRGDDFAGDAWVRYTAVGHKPDSMDKVYALYEAASALEEAGMTALANEVNSLAERLQRAVP